MKEKYLGEGEDYVNLKFCAKCPHCSAINEKKSRSNAFTCHRCQRMFCYICNKGINGIDHYSGKSHCHSESDPYTDFWEGLELLERKGIGWRSGTGGNNIQS